MERQSEKQTKVRLKVSDNGWMSDCLVGSPSGEPMFSLCRKLRKFAGHCKVT